MDAGFGRVGVQPRGGGRGNIARGVLPAHRGRGVASRAGRLVSDLRLARSVWCGWRSAPIQGTPHPVSLPRRQGFHLGAVRKSYGGIERYQALKGRRFDEAMYLLLKSEFDGT